MTTTPSNNSRRKPVVYVVDDDEGMRRALTVLMTTVGYNAVAFAKAADFLAKFDPDQHG